MGMGWLTDRKNRWYEKPRGRPSAITLVGASEEGTEKRFKYAIPLIVDMFIHGGYRLVYCGMGSGLAGQVARQVLSRKGKVTAVLVRGLEPPDVPDGCNRVYVRDLYSRQRKLLALGRGTFVLPGGYGTLSELAMVVALKAAGAYPHGIVVLNIERWISPISQFYRAAARTGECRVGPDELFSVMTDLVDAAETLNLCAAGTRASRK